MTLRSSDLQSDSDLDSICNSCDVYRQKLFFRSTIIDLALIKFPFSGVESIRILQMCFNLNIFLRVQRSHRVIRIQPSIRVSGTSVSAAKICLSIKFFVVVHPVDKVHRQLLFRTEIDK